MQRAKLAGDSPKQVADAADGNHAGQHEGDTERTVRELLLSVFTAWSPTSVGHQQLAGCSPSKSSAPDRGCVKTL